VEEGERQQSLGKHLTHIYEQCSFLISGRIRRRQGWRGRSWNVERVAAK
jgi:hypothetical protein